MKHRNCLWKEHYFKFRGVGAKLHVFVSSNYNSFSPSYHSALCFNWNIFQRQKKTMPLSQIFSVY